jgi:uncharacterized protein YcbX
MTARIASLYRYPVKGLSGESLEHVVMSQGGTFPNDRAYAIENGPSGFDAAAPAFLSKQHFLMLMRNGSLAALATRYDDDAETLEIRQDGRLLAEGRLTTENGRAAIEAFFAGYSSGELRGAPRVLRAPGHTFADCGMKVVSLINLASLEELAGHVGAAIHPLRFRANLYAEGLPAWREFDFLGKRIRIGGVTFEGIKRISRCAATNVDPVTAARDLAIPRTLLQAYGHPDCGVYLRAVAGGELAPGDPIALLD